jgi:hypothetical protein
MNKRYFTGIGSRETPGEIQLLMTDLGYALSKKKYILRSGGAPGADTAFEYGTLDALHETGVDRREIYMPWKGFNRGEKRDESSDVVPSGDLLDLAMTLASSIHPAWDKCSPAARTLHSRNVFQIWGRDLETPSEFVILWATPVGKRAVKGGTNMAYQIALAADIPIYNLYYETDRKEVSLWL